MTALFIDRRFIPHDGTRRVIAAGVLRVAGTAAEDCDRCHAEAAPGPCRGCGRTREAS